MKLEDYTHWNQRLAKQKDNGHRQWEAALKRGRNDNNKRSS